MITDENLNPDPEEFQEEESGFVRDKIFDNEFGQTELDTRDKSFNLDPNLSDRSMEDKIDEMLYYDLVKSLLIENPKYARFNQPTKDGTFLKINKVDINDMYRTVLESISEIKNIEAFSIITSLYDISPEKFYESLSNTFKSDLITELKARGYLKNRKSLF
jgi:hypothetical protein